MLAFRGCNCASQVGNVLQYRLCSPHKVKSDVLSASYTFGKMPLDFQTFRQCRIHQKEPTLLHHACTRLHAAYTPSARRYVLPHNRATTTTRNANGRAEILSEQQKFRPPVNDKTRSYKPKNDLPQPTKIPVRTAFFTLCKQPLVQTAV